MFRTVTLASVAMLACLPLAAWSRSPEVLPDGTKAVTLKIDAHRRMTLDGKPTSGKTLMTALSRVTAGDHHRAIIIRPNANMRFGEFEALMQRLRQAGYTRVTLRKADVTSAARP